MLHTSSSRISSKSFKSLPSSHRRTLSPWKSYFRPDAGLDFNTKYVQEMLTVITADGVVQVPGNFVARPKDAALGSPQQPFPTWEEQKLVVGGSFLVSASNGNNPSRRINFLGFCQSTDILLESVEEVVTTNGGEIMFHEKKVKSGVHETVKLSVAVPLLWGVPPQVELLSLAIRQGGGILDRVYQQWYMY